MTTGGEKSINLHLFGKGGGGAPKEAIASMEVERAGGSEGGTSVPLKTILMRSTKRTLDMFVGQEGAPAPAFMARLDYQHLLACRLSDSRQMFVLSLLLLVGVLIRAVVHWDTRTILAVSRRWITPPPLPRIDSRARCSEHKG